MRVNPRVHLSVGSPQFQKDDDLGRLIIKQPDVEAAATDDEGLGMAAHGKVWGPSEVWTYPSPTQANDVRPASEEEFATAQTRYDPDNPWGDRPVMPHPDGGFARATTNYGKSLLEDPEFQRTGNAPLFYQAAAHPPILGGLYGTSNGARVTHALLGVLGQQAQALHGQLPVPDASLSSDSAKIAKRLQAKGVVAPNSDNPNAEVGNDFGRENLSEEEIHLKDRHVRDDVEAMKARVSPAFTRLSEEDVRRGQQFMSQALHPAKTPAAAEAVAKPQTVAPAQAVDETPEPTLFDRDWNKDG